MIKYDKNSFYQKSKVNLFGFLVAFLLPTTVFTQTVYTFTNAGATGRNGPTQSNVNSTYTSGNNLHNGVTINTQGYQEWTVPANGVYTIEVWGAQGGNAGNNITGGKGARMKGDFTLTQGTVLQIVVGQQGTTTSGYSSAGGGGSFVVKKTNSEKLIIAGGGGGVGNSSSYGNTSSNIHGSVSEDGNPGYGLSGNNAKGGTGGGGGYTTSSYGGGGGGGFTGDGQHYNNNSYQTGGKGFPNGLTGGSYGNHGGFGGGAGGWSGCSAGGGGG